MQRSEGVGGISNFLNSCCKFTEHRPMTPPPPHPPGKHNHPSDPLPHRNFTGSARDACIHHSYGRFGRSCVYCIELKFLYIHVIYIVKSLKQVSDPLPLFALGGQHEYKYTSYPSDTPPPSEKLEPNMHLTDN